MRKYFNLLSNSLNFFLKKMYGDQSGECELVKIKGVLSWGVGLN